MVRALTLMFVYFYACVYFRASPVFHKMFKNSEFLEKRAKKSSGCFAKVVGKNLFFDQMKEDKVFYQMW